MAKYVGLRQGNVHESHVISEYYCGGCGWPVTDHDSFCPECGGAFRESDAGCTEDESAKLREDLEFERSENGWAREFLNRMRQKCGTKDCPSLVEYVTNLEAENAKLRELCERCAIELYVNGNVTDAATENLFDDMRELGIEVVFR